MPLPEQAVIDKCIDKLGDLIEALESHPLFTPPKPQATLYYMWDFVNRNRHLMRELPKVKEEQGQQAAERQWSDAVGRCVFAKILINDTSGKLALMTGADPSNPLDFGDDVKKEADELEGVLPENI
ncbi:MAG: hypothetical protein M1823_006061 [Watsoniomyces obsoletus]|nr:MAG: hypothetical protein M1823_006061 [Watsoniomyces obsoletus]